MKRPQLVSFDMDGTLTDMSFVDSVWLQGIPRLYAVKNQVSFEEARKKVKSEYDEIGKERLEWYDLSYWLKRFDIDVTPDGVLSSFTDRLRVFEEVPRVLEKLKTSGLRLIVVTNARREFVDLEMTRTGIQGYFERVFSSPSDFSLTKNGTGVYEKVCAVCKIRPNQMIHVGDDEYFDFEVPKKLGISAFLLDRTRKKTGPFIVSNLEELETKI